VLAPIFGADSRDGLDWAGGHFWSHRRQDQRRPGRSGSRRSGRSGPHDLQDLRTSDSPESAAAAPAAAAACRTVPAGG
jgi:hypothetical protein